MQKTAILGLCGALLCACSGSGTSGGSGSGGSGAGAGGANAAGSGGASGTGGAASGGAAGAAGSGAGGVPPDLGSGACLDFTPCGGDVIGTWTTTSVCFDPEVQGVFLICPEVDETITFSGSTEFRADGTTTASLTLRSRAVLPPSCHEGLGECGLGALASCTPGDADSCVCDSETTNAGQEGTSTINGNLLVIVRDGMPNYSYYCREGETLRTRGVDEENGRISVVEWALD